MATPSFANIQQYSWNPGSVYQSIQTIIQNEVAQGLWNNQTHTQGWCCVQTSSPYGANNTWVTHTYKKISNPAQTTTVIWPHGWPPPAENSNGDLPGHFFDIQVNTVTSYALMANDGDTQPLSSAYASPNTPPVYLASGLCI